MKKSKPTRMLVCFLTAGMLLSSASCTLDSTTTSSLVDLYASSAGGLVQILVTSALNGLINLGNFAIDLGAPISTQVH